MAEYLKIYPENPQERLIEKAVQIIKQGGIVIFPSDTVYAIGCDLTQVKALEKLAKIQGVKLNKAQWSFVCADLSHLSDFTKPMDTATFKRLKKYLPGPYTFVLEANNKLPKSFDHRKTVGIRVPNHPIPRLLVERLGNPLVSTSIHDPDTILEYTTDPELIFERWSARIDVMIDSGYGDNQASTVVDLTGHEPVVLRQGKGDFIE
ncbi:MAG: hypothetical protein RL501_75 [Bacteroidota bacterium]|jgi:tRNA threonylcarbamoyl adenosine modification protein (Sua5/YciO/YrdC/YwlC family)